MNINNLLWNNKARHLNPRPKIVIKGSSKMLKGYADIIRKDFKNLNCSDKHLVKTIEIHPQLKSEDHRRVFGEAFPMEKKILVSMTDNRNKVLNKEERERTLMHEIGHIKYYNLPDSEKNRIADEEEYSYNREKRIDSMTSFPSFYELMSMKTRSKKQVRPKYVVINKNKAIVYGPTSFNKARQFFNDTDGGETNPFKLPNYRVVKTYE